MRMKISEIMTILQNIQNEHGDIDVMFEDSEFENTFVLSVDVQQQDCGHWLNRDEYVEYVKREGLDEIDRRIDLEELQSDCCANDKFYVYDGTNIQNVVVFKN